MSILISCEAGGESVPRSLITSTKRSPETLSRHRSKLFKLLDETDQLRRNKHKRPSKKRFAPFAPGQLPHRLRYDFAARYVARRMAKRLSAPIIENSYSMDLIDVTRSINHPQLFPALTRHWPAKDRQALVDQIYDPHRRSVRRSISQMFVRSNLVVHFSVRSFSSMAPTKSSGKKSKAKPRRADVGLLYDVSSIDEVDLSADLCEEMYYEAEMLKVRRNYPRRGSVDSITKAMRSKFRSKSKDQYYIGIEILVNQAWACRKGSLRQEAVDRMCDSIQGVLQVDQSDDASVLAAG